MLLYRSPAFPIYHAGTEIMIRPAQFRIGMAAGLMMALASSLAAQTTQPVSAGGAIQWKWIGPGAYGACWGAAFHPKDPKTLIAGLDMGFAFVTRDGGESWSPLGQMGKTPFGQPAYRGGWNTAFDPRRPDTIWMTSDHGCSRSDDGGKTWRLVLGGKPESYCPIAIDPSDSDIVYVANGRSVRAGVSWTSGDLYKTTDGGKTWQTVHPGSPTDKDSAVRNWTRILIDPQSSPTKGKGHSRVYIAGQGGFLASDNAGGTWTSLEDKIPGGVVDLNKGGETTRRTFKASGICDLAMVPGKGRGILFGTFQAVPVKEAGRTWRGGVYRSDDGGMTWTEKNKGLEKTLANLASDEYRQNQKGELPYSMIAAAPSDPKILYFACYNKVYKSADQGENWTLVTHPANDWRKVTTPDGQSMFHHVRVGGGNFANSNWGGPDAINGLAVSPTDANVVAYTDNAGVGLSTDGGKTWDEPMFEYGKPFSNDSKEADKFPGCIPMRLTHLTRAKGAQLIVPNTVAIDPFDPKTLAVGYMDVGLQISRDGGTWWEWAWEGIYPNEEQNNATAVAYDPAVKGRIFLGTGTRGGKIYRSDNSGKTFEAVYPADKKRGPRINELIIDPSSSKDARTIYAATGDGILKTVDGGKNWMNISEGLGTAKAVFRLAIDPADPKRLYAGSDPSAKGSSDGGLFATDDAGKTWRQLGKGQLGSIRTISICQAKPDVLCIVALAPGKTGAWALPNLWLSRDRGATWTCLDKTRCSLAAIHPRDPNIIYVGHWAADITKDDVGLLKSSDSGKTWQRIDDGLSFTTGVMTNDRILFDPADARHFFVLLSAGVLEGFDPAVAK